MELRSVTVGLRGSGRVLGLEMAAEKWWCYYFIYGMQQEKIVWGEYFLTSLLTDGEVKTFDLKPEESEWLGGYL